MRLLASSLVVVVCLGGGLVGGGRSASVASEPSPSPAGSSSPLTAPSSPAPDTVDTGEDVAFESDAGTTAKERQANASSSNAFSLALYRELRAAQGNLIASATSVRLAGGMAQLGASGQTASEMAAALRTDVDPLRAAALAKAERSDWASVTDSELAIANRLWVASAFPIRPGYLAAVSDAYGAPAETVDFTAAEPARQKINGWGAIATKGKIPQLIGEVDPSTKAVITNAIYFKGSWSEKFAKSNTVEEPFRLDAEQTVKTPMMHERGALRFAAFGGVRVVQKTYGKSGRMAMLFVLPDKVDGLGQLEESLTEGKLRSWVGSLTEEDVVLALPRFKIERTLPLRAVLEWLGMPTAFDRGRADFSRLSPKTLFVSDVVQKALVEVDEEGTVAAAATSMRTAETSASTPSPPRRFIADHPFLFFLRDTSTGRILFMGRVMNPKS